METSLAKLVITEVDEASAVGYLFRRRPGESRRRVQAISKRTVYGLCNLARASWRLRSPRRSWRRWNGQGLQGPPCDFGPGRGDEGPASRTWKGTRNLPIAFSGRSRCRPDWNIPTSRRSTRRCVWTTSSLMLMEFVEGTTLEAMLKHGPLPPSGRPSIISPGPVGIVLRARARHRASRHQAGQHDPDARGRGQADGLRHRQAGADRSLTQTGATVGSLYYMSPEQIKGATDLDSRSDLYSLGVSLYEIVTGARPFQGDSDYSIMAAHLEKNPVPPIQIDPSLPAPLSEIILTAIAKDPAQRFQSADAFRAALESVKVRWAVTGPRRPMLLRLPNRPGRGPAAGCSHDRRFAGDYRSVDCGSDADTEVARGARGYPAGAARGDCADFDGSGSRSNAAASGRAAPPPVTPPPAQPKTTPAASVRPPAPAVQMPQPAAQQRPGRATTGRATTSRHPAAARTRPGHASRTARPARTHDAPGHSSHFGQGGHRQHAPRASAVGARHAAGCSHRATARRVLHG